MNLSNEFVIQNNQRILAQFGIQPRYKPEPQWQAPNKVRKSRPREENGKAETSSSENLKKWLMAVSIYQYDKILTEIFELAQFSLGTGSRTNKQAEQRGLVRNIRANIGRGSPRYPILTEKGNETLGIKPAKFYGKGSGPEHILHQRLIARHLAQYKPKIELNRKGKFMDIGMEINGKLVCIEVQMTQDHIKENLEKDIIQAGASLVIVACVDKKVRAKATEIVTEMPDQIKNKTQIFVVRNLLEMNPDELLSMVNR